MKKKIPYFAAGIVFLLVLFTGIYFNMTYEELKSKKKQQQLGNIANTQALLIAKKLSRSLDATYLLAHEVRRTQGNVADFDKVAEELIDKFGGITNLQLAPGAIIQHIFPLAGNEKAIGLNLLQDKNRHNAAKIAIDTGLLTLTGPFELIQGGVAVIGRNPVFLKAEGKEYFWGFTSALILLEDLLAETDLNNLQNRGYYWEISYICPEKNKETTFFSKQIPSGLTSHSASFDVQNNTWTLIIYAQKPTGQSSRILYFILWTGFSLLLSGAIYSLLSQPEKLRGIVRKRTAELRKREKQLQESEAKFRGLVELSYDWIWAVDRDGVYTYASPQVEKILGYKPEEIVGKTPFHFMPPDEAEKIVTFFRESVRNAVSIVALENIALHKNGKSVILETSGVPFFDETGKVAGYRGIDRNISERKKMEEEKEKIQEAVIDSKKMWENTFDTIPLMICILDEKHEIIRINKAMADGLGKPIEQLVHTPCYVTVHGTDTPPDYCPHSKLLQDHKIHMVEIFEKNLNAHLAVTVAPLYNGNNKFIGSVHIAQDITERKKHEEKLSHFTEKLQEMVDEQTLEIKEREKQLLHAEKLNAVGRFSASIAHEFNNPLQGVLTVIKGVQTRATLTKQDQELVELAVKECGRMTDLIQNLQQFNRPTSGIKVESNVHQIIDEVLLFAKKECKSKQITLTTDYAEDLPVVWVVVDQIKQVFLNMVGNACDAISDNEGEISISTTSLNKKGISIVIKDSGSGIKPENLEHIFEPFYTTKDATGTGLGSSISYGIIKSHGGNINVESEVGKGATFTITLPIGVRK